MNARGATGHTVSFVGEANEARLIRRPDVDWSPFRKKFNLRIRHAVGLVQDPPPMCEDPTRSYMPVDGVARLVHGDLSTMIIGGLGSLFLQMLHPHAMAGVAQHSRYQNDALGRLLQTANFIGHTTYGTKTQAYLDIERVLAVHEAVRGVADDGVAYYANDPHLLAWVHACEASMFLAAYQRYGRVRLRPDEADSYVKEMSQLARDLGAENPPTSVATLWRQIEGFRPELRLSADGREARKFVAEGFVQGWSQTRAHHFAVRSSYDLMPVWARDQLGVSASPLVSRALITPASHALCGVVRRFVPPTERVRVAL
jgi:uncharacterized protein (DUF2236 family)